VVAAVSAALASLPQATRLPLQLIYTAIGALIDGCGS
jgi:hypothetical protein